MERVSLDPVLPQNPKVFILVTKPGNLELRKQEYYANNGNSFWKIVYELTGEIFSKNYAQRIDFLKRNHIAIWDVVQFGERINPGAQNVKNEVPNPINEIVEMYPSIKQIIFNGQKAHDLYRKHFTKIEGIIYDVVLSTSLANTRFSFREKLNNWKEKIV
ncbi:DNA-deoxyinosine glycosylase [Polaribacter sp.]|uniref:DNA-deoxyinosine glycosylase n=1 Tax=Polaribacter sp. TaxID=1920175 RepID=UPI0025D0EB57|nr:DNA-deoxyinosine glycosylase [Polaribacter sp.]